MTPSQRAAEEIRSTVYWPKDINGADIPKITAIIDKQFAPLIEAAENLVRVIENNEDDLEEHSEYQALRKAIDEVKAR